MDEQDAAEPDPDQLTLFEADPAGDLKPGDPVVAQTIWGDERARVIAVGASMVSVLTEVSGDTLTLSTARVRPLP